MTSQDNLRDRIADLIVGGETLSREGSEYVAQAIIDELGLTMETNAAVEGPRHMRRIISEWEWE